MSWKGLSPGKKITVFSVVLPKSVRRASRAGSVATCSTTPDPWAAGFTAAGIGALCGCGHYARVISPSSPPSSLPSYILTPPYPVLLRRRRCHIVMPNLKNGQSPKAARRAFSMYKLLTDRLGGKVLNHKSDLR